MRKRRWRRRRLRGRIGEVEQEAVRWWW